jgi:hypothetical protein
VSLEADLSAQEGELGDLSSAVDALESELANVDMDGAAALALMRLDDQGDLVISGANVYIQNGEDVTDSANSKGNLILGYNESDALADHSGSHNLVLGVNNSFSSYAGFVGGERNAISGPFASVFTGELSTASGIYAAVVTGQRNSAAGQHNAVLGGRDNSATFRASAVVGGQDNTARNDVAVALGGDGNQTSAEAEIVP